MDNSRRTKLIIGLLVAAGILLGRIFYIQIINDRYKRDASNNSMVYDIIYPTRGAIYDRNGKILVGNKVAYDILVTPREVQPFDTLALARVLEVPLELIKEKMAEYSANKRKIGFQSVVMLKQISVETYMRFDEVKYMFPGFKGQSRSIRDYPVNAGGNLLGYVSEVDQAFLDKHSDEYRRGDYAGKTGIEAAREKDLRGEKGYHIYLRNSHNQIEEPYNGGADDVEAVPGHEDASLKLQVAWQQNVVDQLLGAESFPAAKALISRMKAEYKIKKTGPLATCKNPAECYMLVGKDGKVETVLGPGSSTRTDFRTLTSAPATLPANMDIIWFTFAK